MVKSTPLRLPFAAVLASMLVSAAGCDEASPRGASIEIPFAARVGGEPFACDQTFSAGDPAVGVRPLDLRFYVHDVALLDADGVPTAVTLENDGKWQSSGVALLDFEDKTGTCANGTEDTNDRVRGTAPAGDYVGLSFKVGVPEFLNHEDATLANSPLNVSTLFWIWRDGYKFLRADFETVESETAVLAHLGSTGCVGNPPAEEVTCERANRPDVTLEAFDAAKDVVVLDYGRLVADLDLENDQGGESGCMSGAEDPECEAMFDVLGLDLATGEASGEQSLFSVEASP
jgi:uncharacterized repeat protein (TIGR04052 family)